ncbi:5-methylcytosine rRNA methyltransferase NSUN4 [Neodiprion virginianus]|uniref:5-methylcytosine rRNA methyltransferase NSUN4 n=1 Tax=Neodiprion virginianus TaxID=2961670 RepID=UPI001EE7748B|nr:5-methylcytosine rRNA methyltransferase NSUN4 [Neodiprion virginianus]
MSIVSFTSQLKHLKVVKVPYRFKHKDTHWSVVKKTKTHTTKALEHFDDFYDTVYGRLWPDVRTALLAKNNKYMAVVNNFSDTDRIAETLENYGAINLRAIYKAQRQLLKSLEREKANQRKLNNLNKGIDEFPAASEQSLQVQSSDFLDSTDSKDETEEDSMYSNNSAVPAELLSIAGSESSGNLDLDRIINPQNELSMSSLHQYVPATQLKGMEDYILESEHYDYYKKGSDLSIKVEKQRKLNFPEYLNIYTFEEENDTRFSSPRKGSTGVLDYYLLDGGSILPVLALDLRPNDHVLDMCAAPGGKTLITLQTLLPDLIVANDTTFSRVNRIKNVIDQYLDGMGQWDKKLVISQNDARAIGEQDKFNKILVDVPCTTDRHSLHENDNNIFKPSRIKERLQLPEMQTEILLNALKIVRPGGTVVYSTCSLSPIQNDGVVQMALKKSWEETNSIFIVKNMSPSLHPLKCIYNLSRHGLKYGQVLLPSLGNNFGPMYFCKIIKVR